jgi:antitoxin component HigA of HigAB toxin-antitoxin module
MTRPAPARALPRRQPRPSGGRPTSFGDPFGETRTDLDYRHRDLPVAAIVRNPDQPRKHFDAADAAALELALIENAAREDLTPVEVARTLSTLINDLGLTQAVLAKRIGRSRSDLANTLRLLDLGDEILRAHRPRPAQQGARQMLTR